MSIMTNFNIEIEDTPLGDLYPTKKVMNDDMGNIANRGYAQPKSQYTFSSEHINRFGFEDHEEIGVFPEKTTKVYNTIFRKMYETKNIRHNFLMLLYPQSTTEAIYPLVHMWSLPLNPQDNPEYNETKIPVDRAKMFDYKFVKSFIYNQVVYKPFITYVKIVDGKIEEKYIEGSANQFRTLSGLKTIVDENREDIYISGVSMECALWNKNTNTWNYNRQLMPILYGFNEVNCLQSFMGMFAPFSQSIRSSTAKQEGGLVSDIDNKLKTYYYDYNEGTTRRIFDSNLCMLSSLPEFTFTPFDIDNPELTKAQITITDNDSVWVSSISNISTDYVTYKHTRYLKPSFVYKKLAELGVYMTSYQGATSGYYEEFCADRKPNELKNYSDVFLGEMLENGITTGNFLVGDEIDKSNTPNKNGSTDDINYKPIFDVSNDDIIDNFQYGTQTSLNINQFVSSYVLDGVDLQKLSNEFKNPTNEIPSGDTPFDNIISLKKYPFNVKNHVIMYEPSNIILSKWDTNISAQKINATQTLINIGSFTIDKKYNNFLDYEPYTTCEIYLPFADYVPLNLNKCMGNTINIEMIWDIDGNIKYLILCEGLLIAEINANLSSSQTLTAINSGLKSLQDLQNTITIASGLTSVAGSAVAGAPIGIVSSAISTVSGVVNAVTNQNTNYSTQKGQSQSDVSQKTILDFILHITRPIVKIPANYASTIGYILNDTKVLSELSGFTVCDNVIINNINCLNNEKTEIKNLLESGVIL